MNFLPPAEQLCIKKTLWSNCAITYQLRFYINCENHDTFILLISDSGSSTTTSHNLDDFISMDPTVGIGDVLHLMDFVKKFFRNWFYLEKINWLYILYNGATLLTIYNKCWRWKKNVLTKKSTTLMVTYYTYLKLIIAAAASFFL